MKLIVFILVVQLNLLFCEAAINVRLMGGKLNREGRVEVFYNGSWGTVCDDKWSLKDAYVVCRSLGLPNATSAPFGAPFGPGTGPIWMDNVECSGSESSLPECPHQGFGSHDCGHSEDAGVVCGYPSPMNSTITNLTGEISSPGYPRGMERANYEWIFKPSIPRPVVALYFEELDLSRTNRGTSELSLKNSKNVTVIDIKNEKRKPRTGWILEDPWKLHFYSLFTITYSKRGNHGRGFRSRYFVFSDLGDEGSCLSHWNVQVYAGVGALDISWNPLPNIATVSYLVMYNDTGKDVQNFTMVTNGTSVRITYLRTDTLYSVQLIGFNPTSVSQVKYSCTKLKKTKRASWRLVGGKLPNEGVVQIDYNNKWGTLCAYNWDINDAKVACRTLRLPSARYAITRTAQFNVSERQAWVSNLRCLGNESSLIDCPHGGWGNLHALCRHSYIAGVVCGYPNVTKLDITSVFGVITSPGYPKYMEQAHYEWTFKPPVSRARLVVYFEDINLNRHDQGVSNLTMTDADGTQTLCVKSREIPRFSYRFDKTPSKIVYYSSFTSSIHTKGFRMFYLVLNDAQASLIGNWNTTAISTTPRSINVHWSKFNNTADMILVAYLVTHEAKTRPGSVFYSIVDNNSSAIVINGLVGYSHYKVQVFAYLRAVSTGTIRMFMGKPIDIQTIEGVPVRPPPNITITFIDFKYVHIKWNPISQEYTHGNLLGYNLYYQDYLRTIKKTMITVRNNHRYVLLTNLVPAMLYRLQIAGFTAKGQGQMQYKSFLTKCGNVIEDRLAGKILMPNISYRKWKVDCEWTLKPRHGGGLVLVMVEAAMLMPRYFPCSELYVGLVNDKDRTIDSFCLRRPFVSIVSYGTAKVRFHSSVAWQFKREAGLKASYLIFRNGLDEVQLYPDWKIAVTNHNASTINIQWDKLPKIGSKSTKFIAVCISKADGTDISAASTNSSATNVQVGNLKAYSVYKVQVLAFLGNLDNIDREKEILKSQMVVITTLKKDWNPRYPSRHDIANSIRMRVKGLNVLLWNQLYDFTFKKTLALEVTKFCANTKRCPLPRQRTKRSVIIRHIAFTQEQVHLLPGYPMQMSYSYNPENMLAAITFYLRFPPEYGMNSTDVLSQDLLLDAVKASVGPISKAINKTILSVSPHRRVTPPKAKTSQSNEAAIIGGSVTAVVILIVIVAIVFFIVSQRGRYVFKKDDEQPVIEMQHPEAEPPQEKEKPEERPTPRRRENKQEITQQEGQQEQEPPKETPEELGYQGGAGTENRGMEMKI